jgi:hypothetical protein
VTSTSKREIEKQIDEVSAGGEYSVHDLMLATLKDVYNGDLTAGEQRLLNTPEEHLSQRALRESRRIDIDCMEYEP